MKVRFINIATGFMYKEEGNVEQDSRGFKDSDSHDLRNMGGSVQLLYNYSSCCAAVH